jgi:ATP-dependent DNA helicase DinG
MAEDAVALPEREDVSFEDDPTVAPLDAGPQNGEATEAAPKPTMRDVFGPGGFLERCMIGGYEHRRGQLEMAEMVHDAFEKHHHAILEAGTGTGKTLAYLVPAICSGRRVVISTATKSLQ